MSALIAVLIFPVLTLLLVALTKAENMLGSLAVEPAQASLRLVPDVVNDAPTGDALPVPQPRLGLVGAREDLAA
jgi:hypothetical protein